MCSDDRIVAFTLLTLFISLLTQFISEKRYLLHLPIYLRSHLVNQIGVGGLGFFAFCVDLAEFLDVGGVDVIFPVV